MRVTKGRGTVSHHVTVCVCVGLLPRTVKGPGFQVYFSFSLPKSPAGLETHKGTPELRGEQLAQVLFTCNLSCVAVLFMFKSSSHQPPSGPGKAFILKSGLLQKVLKSQGKSVNLVRVRVCFVH